MYIFFYFFFFYFFFFFFVNATSGDPGAGPEVIFAGSVAEIGATAASFTDAVIEVLRRRTGPPPREAEDDAPTPAARAIHAEAVARNNAAVAALIAEMKQCGSLPGENEVRAIASAIVCCYGGLADPDLIGPLWDGYAPAALSSTNAWARVPLIAALVGTGDVAGAHALTLGQVDVALARLTALLADDADATPAGIAAARETVSITARDAFRDAVDALTLLSSDNDSAGAARLMVLSVLPRLVPLADDPEFVVSVFFGLVARASPFAPTLALHDELVAAGLPVPPETWHWLVYCAAREGGVPRAVAAACEMASSGATINVWAALMRANRIIRQDRRGGGGSGGGGGGGGSGRASANSGGGGGRRRGSSPFVAAAAAAAAGSNPAAGTSSPSSLVSAADVDDAQWIEESYTIGTGPNRVNRGDWQPSQEASFDMAFGLLAANDAGLPLSHVVVSAVLPVSFDSENAWEVLIAELARRAERNPGDLDVPDTVSLAFAVARHSGAERGADVFDAIMTQLVAGGRGGDDWVPKLQESWPALHQNWVAASCYLPFGTRRSPDAVRAYLHTKGADGGAFDSPIPPLCRISPEVLATGKVAGPVATTTAAAATTTATIGAGASDADGDANAGVGQKPSPSESDALKSLREVYITRGRPHTFHSAADDPAVQELERTVLSRCKHAPPTNDPRSWLLPAVMREAVSQVMRLPVTGAAPAVELLGELARRDIFALECLLDTIRTHVGTLGHDDAVSGRVTRATRALAELTVCIVRAGLTVPSDVFEELIRCSVVYRQHETARRVYQFMRRAGHDSPTFEAAHDVAELLIENGEALSAAHVLEGMLARGSTRLPSVEEWNDDATGSRARTELERSMGYSADDGAASADGAASGGASQAAGLDTGSASVAGDTSSSSSSSAGASASSAEADAVVLPEPTLRTHLLLIKIKMEFEEWDVVREMYERLFASGRIDEVVARTMLVAAKNKRAWPVTKAIIDDLETLGEVSSFGYYTALAACNTLEDPREYYLAHPPCYALSVAYPPQALRLGGMEGFFASLDDVEASCPRAVDEALLFAIDLRVKRRDFSLVYAVMDILADKRPSILPEVLAKVIGHLVMHNSYESMIPVIRRYTTPDTLPLLYTAISTGDSFTGASKAMIYRLVETINSIHRGVTFAPTPLFHLTAKLSGGGMGGDKENWAVVVEFFFFFFFFFCFDTNFFL
jgi:hypothetical protein